MTREIQVIKEVNLSINHGNLFRLWVDQVQVKSTLLYLLSTMDTDYEGQLYIHNELVTGQMDAQLSKIRNEKNWFCVSVPYLLMEYNV
jgi:lipoprotein-releasing system ATP-binding protein